MTGPKCVSASVCFYNFRGLAKTAEFLQCKDPSLDSQQVLTTVDVAFVNNDLVNSLLEILNEKHKEKKNTSKMENYKIEIKALDTSKEKGKKLTQDIFIEPSQLTHAEQLAHEVFSLSVHLSFYVPVNCLSWVENTWIIMTVRNALTWAIHRKVTRTWENLQLSTATLSIYDHLVDARR